MPYDKVVDIFCERYDIPLELARHDLDSMLATWRQYFEASSVAPGIEGPVNAPPEQAHLVEEYRLQEYRFRLRIYDPELAHELSPRLESLHSLDGEEPNFLFDAWRRADAIVLARDGQIIASEENPNAIRSILLQEMVRCTEPSRDWTAILHAGACGDDQSCVMIAGKSHSGKTTLAAALMASGLKFYCDDSAAMSSDDGKVSPMPFRMMIREGSWQALHSRHPEVLSSPVFQRWGQNVRFLTPTASQVARSPGLAKALVFVSYSREESTSLRQVDAFTGLLKLQESGFWVKHDEKTIERFLGWLQSMPLFTLTYSDLDEAIATVRELAEN